MKRIIGLITALIILCTSMAVFGASLDYNVNYDDSTVTLNYKADAKYRQRVSFILYPAVDGNGNPTDVTVFSNITRITEAYADENGNAEVVFTLTELDPVGFYTAEAQGGGYAFETSAAKREGIEFKNKEYINETLLPKFSTMNASDVHNEFEKEINVLALEKNERFVSDRDKVEELFVPCRKEDYPEGFNSIAEIKTVIDTCYLIIDLNAATDRNSVQTLITDNASIIDMDFEDKDYTNDKDQIYKTLIGLDEFKKINSVSDIERLLNESIALTAVNNAKLTSLGGVIAKYLSVFGIDADEYAALCEKYGASEVNKGFVGRNFTNAGDLVSEYISRKSALEKDAKTDKNTGGSTGSTKTYYADNTKGTVQDGTKKPAVFSDLSEAHWAYNAVLSMKNDGIINGYPDGTFRPEESVTREQFIKMLLVSLGITPSENGAAFKDVEKGRWSYGFISAARELNISNGTDEGDFLPEKTVTRQDAVAMIFRALAISGKEPLRNAGDSIFTDSESISAYARDAVYALEENGIVSGMGDSTFNPLGNMTRAQAATILWKTIKYFKG